jgi:hypothetical protein
MADTPFRGNFSHFVWWHEFEPKMQLLQNSKKWQSLGNVSLIFFTTNPHSTGSGGLPGLRSCGESPAQ